MNYVVSRPALLLVIAAALFTSAVRAQSGYGSVARYVHDPRGGVIPKAQVTLTNQLNGTRNSAFTNETGYYVVPNLPPGSYTVTVEASGFKTFSRTANKLEPN